MRVWLMAAAGAGMAAAVAALVTPAEDKSLSLLRSLGPHESHLGLLNSLGPHESHIRSVRSPTRKGKKKRSESSGEESQSQSSEDSGSQTSEDVDDSNDN